MSFASRLGPLVRELIEASAPPLSQRQPQDLDRLSHDVLTKLKSRTFLQTNHFEVEKALLGLDERFRVNHRDDLADALWERLDTLKSLPSRWNPEVLHLLLELSDQPTFKSELRQLELLQPTADTVTENLRWEDIAREDGWSQDDEALWKPIDYSDESGDEVFEQPSVHESEATSVTGDVDRESRTAELYIIQPGELFVFEQVRASQRWRGKAAFEESLKQTKKAAVPEIQVVREVLFMLQGLDCTLFSQDGLVVQAFQVENMEWEPFRAIMQDLMDHGYHLRSLRTFVGQRQEVPHLQAFQDCISTRLRNMECFVSDIQTQLTAPATDVVLSLARLKTELLPWLDSLDSLAEIVSRIESDSRATPFRYLELVFSQSCLAQFSGKSNLYEFFARIFAECFQVYLRPIRLWMDEGKLLSASDLFFVTETSSPTPVGKTWEDRFYLRKTSDEALHAPSFLRTAVGSIYNAGKNVVVLKLLGKSEAAISYRHRDEPPLDYDTICPTGQELVPFPELFDAAFDQWIQSKYRATSTILKTSLFEEWSLLPTVDTLHEVYLMSNGSSAAAFTESIFGKLDNMRTDWSDRYALTAAAQDSFAFIADSGRLTVYVEPVQQRLHPIMARNSVKGVLSGIRIDYRFPWPLEMIFNPATLEHYQSLFTLLLQFKRATHALHKPKILNNYWTDHDNWNAMAIFYHIRTKLLWFCMTFQTYLTTLVLIPLSSQLRRGLASANDMDELIAAHERSIKAMVDQACLGSRLKPIRHCVLDVLDLALKLERIRSGVTDALDENELNKSYEERLREIKIEVETQIRFIWSGLRGVARATSGANSAKWDMLADMLQAGNAEEQMGT